MCAGGAPRRQGGFCSRVTHSIGSKTTVFQALKTAPSPEAIPRNVPGCRGVTRISSLIVLRRSPDRKSKEVRYKLIGECYIDGMMHGQALDIKNATETFVIT